MLSVRPVNRAEADAPVTTKAIEVRPESSSPAGTRPACRPCCEGTALGDTVTMMYREGRSSQGPARGRPVNTWWPSGDRRDPKQRMASLAQGLGLLPDIVVDQHFSQRGRFGRLLALVAPARICSVWASTRTPPPS